ncbi:ATPase-activating ribosome biosynthesis protein [Ceratobasidium sp. 394]|nr:ATPase-activating ribosome biosynthesis protein [Ceratobasidium sp. 394]
MQRVTEVRARRERAFWKARMAVAREKVLASRMRKKLATSKSAQAEEEVQEEAEDEEKDEVVTLDDLVEPIEQKVVLREKVKVPAKPLSRKKKSALVPGGGMSMSMEVD